MKKIFNISMLIMLFAISAHAVPRAGMYQFDLVGGLGSAEAGNEANFPESSYFAKFQGLTTSDKLFRGLGSFTFSMGDSEAKIGEFALGTGIYPFSFIPAIPTQPFVSGAGVMMLSSLAGKTEMKFGYSVGTGIDIRLGRRFGFKMQVEYLVVTANMFRYMGGFVFFFRAPRR